MRKLIILSIVIAIGISITSCKKDNNTIQWSLLENSWTHSFEESIPGQIEVYRPTNYKEFPILRFRQIFNFKHNNICDYLVLLPNDGQYFKNAFWDFDEKANIIKIYNENHAVLYKFEVIELGDNLMKIKAIHP